MSIQDQMHTTQFNTVQGPLIITEDSWVLKNKKFGAILYYGVVPELLAEIECRLTNVNEAGLLPYNILHKYSIEVLLSVGDIELIVNFDLDQLGLSHMALVFEDIFKDFSWECDDVRRKQSKRIAEHNINLAKAAFNKFPKKK
jgi:hypothetical protein